MAYSSSTRTEKLWAATAASSPRELARQLACNRREFLRTAAGLGLGSALLGPSAAGFMFDVSHSYTLPIVASVGANLLAAAVAALAVRHRPRPAPELAAAAPGGED